MSKKKERKFLTLPMTEAEFELVNQLVVEVTKAKNKPTARLEVVRDALNLAAKEYTGQPIF